MSLLTKKRVCAAKIESVTGTAESLMAADGAENFYDPNYEGVIGSYQRQGQGTVSPQQSVPGARYGKITYRTLMYNSGTSTPPFWASRLLIAASMVLNTAGTYLPQTGGASTLTTMCNTNGNLYEIAGAQGNFKIVADKVGEPVKMDWEYMGLYVAPSATALITPTYPTILPPRFAGATITLGGVSYVVRKVEFDPQNKLALREQGNETSGAGYAGSYVADRDPKLNLTIEMPAIGTHDFYADMVAGTEAAFVMVIGTGSNNQVRLSIPKAQLRTAPKQSDGDGIALYDLEFGCNRNSAAGDDEFSLVLL
jgi:hypothetical protein